jgi:ABC-type amino acid transport substrate-binding protein
VLTGSSTQNVLGSLGIHSKGFATIEEGLEALESGTVTAFVAGEGTLRYAVQNEFSGRIVVSPIPNTHQSFSFAMRPGLPQRDAIDVALIDEVSQPDWGAEIQRFVGPSLRQ